jgi:hypothetical protein
MWGQTDRKLYSVGFDSGFWMVGMAGMAGMDTYLELDKLVVGGVGKGRLHPVRDCA